MEAREKPPELVSGEANSTKLNALYALRHFVTFPRTDRVSTLQLLIVSSQAFLYREIFSCTFFPSWASRLFGMSVITFCTLGTKETAKLTLRKAIVIVLSVLVFNFITSALFSAS